MASVLIVDDDPTVRRILSVLLEKRFGATVREAVDGYAGYKAVETDPPDLVLLDVSMPIVDGPAMLEKLRSEERFKDLPVVTISAARERDVVLRMIELGVLDYLRKPLNLTAVQKRLERLFPAIGLSYQPVVKVRFVIGQRFVRRDAG